MLSEKLVNEFLSFNDNVLKRYFQGKVRKENITLPLLNSLIG